MFEKAKNKSKRDQGWSIKNICISLTIRSITLKYIIIGLKGKLVTTMVQAVVWSCKAFNNLIGMGAEICVRFEAAEVVY